MNTLELNSLTKRYQKQRKPALKDFSYDFSDGVYGLLGPNGAGKTTLMNLIVGNLKPDQGTVLYQGREAESLGKEFRRNIGYMPQQQQLYDQFTVKRFLFYFAALKNIDKKSAERQIEELLTLVGLKDMANKRLKALSGGMKQRVLLAQALLDDPRVLILDEPTAGLDPKERMTIRNYIYSIAENKTIILATHVISDVEQIAKEIIFLKNGETILKGTPEEAIQAVSSMVWEIDIPRHLYPKLNLSYGRNRVVGERGDEVTVKIISERIPEIGGVHPAAVSLEDVYLCLYAG